MTKLEEKYTRFLQIGGYLNERQRQLLDLVKIQGIITIDHAIERFPDVPNRTLIRDFNVLESENLIEKIGRGKNISYSPLK